MEALLVRSNVEFLGAMVRVDNYDKVMYTVSFQLNSESRSSITTFSFFNWDLTDDGTSKIRNFTIFNMSQSQQQVRVPTSLSYSYAPAVEVRVSMVQNRGAYKFIQFRNCIRVLASITWTVYV